MRKRIRLLGITIAVLCSTSTLAAVSTEEAKQLGSTTLTEWGAERAGNKDGTIPEYTGKPSPLSPKYNPKEPGTFWNPYADERPLFSITAKNFSQYVDKLTEGQKETFRKYPNYRMDIYPTHRTHVYPKFINEKTIKNATACKTTNSGVTIDGCYGGVPFPIAKTGNEMMWNHVLRWVAPDYDGKQKTINVSANGQVTNQGEQEVWIRAPWFDAKQSAPWPSNSIYYYLRFDAFAPARRVGEKTLILDSLDPFKPGRRAYSYIPGQRRVKLAPDLAYDTPNPVGGGAMTLDESYLFYGAQDRYDFKLIGKKETFIGYNQFDTTDYQKCPESFIATKNFPNPDCMRWELHRTWVVQATLKPSFRHIYPKRVFYFDEDNYGAGTADNFDATGKVYRVTNVISFPMIGENTGSLADNSYTLDLQTGNYSLLGMLGLRGNGWWVVKPHDQFLFSPEAMAGEGIR